MPRHDPGYASFTGATRDYAAAIFTELTRREREILELVAASHNNHEIARRLVLSEKTIRNHVASVLTNLQVSDRTSAVTKSPRRWPATESLNVNQTPSESESVTRLLAQIT